MPSNKFQPLHPRSSLRRLKTAFAPPNSPPQSTASTSPLSSDSNSSSRFSRLSITSLESLPLRRMVIRRKKSTIQLQVEEEQSLVDHELMSLIEPRPSLGPAHGGIEEVLGGSA